MCVSVCVCVLNIILQYIITMYLLNANYEYFAVSCDESCNTGLAIATATMLVDCKLHCLTRLCVLLSVTGFAIFAGLDKFRT